MITQGGDWRPLEGVTVVDLTRMLPGGTATLLLADLGATVHKVEHPVGGDETRGLRPRVGDSSSAQHQYMDRGKRSIRVDLKSADGLGTVTELIATADAVIESFRPGVVDRLGLGFATLVKLNPALVYLSLSGYGQHGPRAQHAGHDLNFMAYSGNLRGGTPATLQADVGGGMLAALALSSGVLRARQTGVGAHIDLALADAALVAGGMQVAERLAADQLGDLVDTPLYGRQPCYRVYLCADGLSLAVGAVEPKFWARIAELVGRPDWIDRQHDPALIAEVEALFASRPRQHWTALLEREDTCVSPVLDSAELVTDPHVIARGSLRRYDSPTAPLWQVAPPIRVIELPDQHKDHELIQRRTSND
jgi:alpha-methylacyl-CoA racemase